MTEQINDGQAAPQDVNPLQDSPRKGKGLSARTRKFVELFDGNGTRTAQRAGFRGSDNVLAQTARRLLRNNQILDLILEREAQEIGPLVIDRVRRQVFWSQVMSDESVAMVVRLKASELLGKSQGDFVDRHEIVDTEGIAERIRRGRERAR